MIVSITCSGSTIASPVRALASASSASRSGVFLFFVPCTRIAASRLLIRQLNLFRQFAPLLCQIRIHQPRVQGGR